MSLIPQLVLNSIIAGSVYALIALGFNLIFSVTKFFNLAHGVIAAVGGYTVFFFANSLGFNIYLAVAIGIVFAGLLGLILEKYIYLPLRRRKASSMVSLVASLGLFIVIEASLAMIFTSQFQTLSSFLTPAAAGQPIYQIFGGTITFIQVLTFASALII